LALSLDQGVQRRHARFIDDDYFAIQNRVANFQLLADQRAEVIVPPGAGARIFEHPDWL
jgi:hypothetical protein